MQISEIDVAGMLGRSAALRAVTETDPGRLIASDPSSVGDSRSSATPEYASTTWSRAQGNSSRAPSNSAYVHLKAKLWLSKTLLSWPREVSQLDEIAFQFRPFGSINPRSIRMA